MGLALGMAWKFYKSVTKRLKLRLRNCSKLIPAFVDVIAEKLVGGTFLSK